MKPSLPLPLVVLLCVVSSICVEPTNRAFAAAHEPHAAASLRGAPPKPGGVGPVSPDSSVLATNVRSRAEVEALITKAGATPPEWWPTVEVKYPPTLNLTWANPGKEWNAQKNLGQYIWDIINPNPSRWREGVRLLHHVLTVNKDSPEKLEKTTEALARVYQSLLQDWARAAFWWRKTIQLGGYDEADFALDLGECYWRLGNREMCVALISQLDEDDTRNGSLIKLWADLGEIDKALKLAEQKAASGEPDSAYLAAGDACRLGGRYTQALGYYRKVVAVPDGPRDIKRNKERAAASIEAIRVFDNLNLARIPDGTYMNSSVAYNGPLHVAVVVKNARIESVKVTQHTEKQFYSAITDTTARIMEKQGVKGVDMTSGATITAEAIVNATAKALANGMK